MLSATQFVSRRFGIFGGLALVGLLAATEGREIVMGLTDKGAVPGDGVEVWYRRSSAMKYRGVTVA